MGTVYKGDLSTKAGRLNAWVDALFMDHAILRIFWTNFAVVKPGRLYRSNHPTPGNLAAFVRKAGIKSVINLRGQAKNGADALSRDAAARLGMDFYDIALESRGAPHRDRILRLAEIYRDMRGPALIHCKSGADRAGLAAGLFVLIEGGTATEALSQLSLRYGHIKQAKTGILDLFFVTYARDGEGKKPFLDWVRDDYSEDALRAAFKANSIAGFINDKILARE
ncbi:MAG: protein tyrosine phosphatase [Acidocella sp. 20-57-95]|nr:MAG: protein tyrosine phosphatase [Acidocella sp. 20-57-95]OYV57946.1 MAG: protein tyrosine phosphatase [Acidocella sp. 21-58-7]HQT63648.1 tyrosine-protein phosphatase [Acidocella sp.]HQU04067.1 tyrosine-protein phosphatase [Acidocella sp.]